MSHPLDDAGLDDLPLRTVSHDQALIHSSEDPNWRTPDACFEKLKAAFNFRIDAAATVYDRKCSEYFGPDHLAESRVDALQVDWHDYVNCSCEAIFLNPPYSRKQYRLTKSPAMLIDNWARKCWEESQRGCTIVGVFPFSPQTEWYTRYVYGHIKGTQTAGKSGVPASEWETREVVSWSGHAAMEEWRLPHRISFLRPDGSKAANAGVNSVIVVWRPNPGFVGPWQPAVRYWSYR